MVILNVLKTHVMLLYNHDKALVYVQSAFPARTICILRSLDLQSVFQAHASILHLACQGNRREVDLCLVLLFLRFDAGHYVAYCWNEQAGWCLKILFIQYLWSMH